MSTGGPDRGKKIFLLVLPMTFPPHLPGEGCQASLLPRISDPQGMSSSRLELRADQDSLNLIEKENNLHSKR